MEERLPDFIIIGAAKSSTTSLHNNLAQHPNLFFADPKEPCFFNIDEHYMLGVDWYKEFFTNAREDQICGEASTEYSQAYYIDSSLNRMYSLLPNAKLIFIMRNPVDRAYSNYRHSTMLKYQEAILSGKKADTLDLSFTDFLKEKDGNVLKTGMYVEIIERYLARYDPSQFLFLLFDDYVNDPEETLNRCCSFLDVPPFSFKNVTASNTSDQNDYHLHRMELVSRWYRIPGVKTLKEFLPKKWKEMIYGYLQTLHRKRAPLPTPPPIDALTRRKLVEIYVPYNERLEKFLGRDLSRWNQ